MTGLISFLKRLMKTGHLENISIKSFDIAISSLSVLVKNKDTNNFIIVHNRELDNLSSNFGNVS